MYSLVLVLAITIAHFIALFSCKRQSLGGKVGGEEKTFLNWAKRAINVHAIDTRGRRRGDTTRRWVGITDRQANRHAFNVTVILHGSVVGAWQGP